MTGENRSEKNFRRPGPWTPVPSHIARDRRYMNCSLAGRHMHLIAWLYSNRERTDGRLSEADLRHVAAESQLSELEANACLGELVSAGLWSTEGGTYSLIDFLKWNLDANEIEKRAAGNLERQHTHRAKKGSPDLSKEPEHTEIQNTQNTQVRNQLRNALQAGDESEEETSMPRQGDTITIREGWESIVGRSARLDEINHAGWLLDQYGDRMTANQILEVINHIHGRELTKGNPTHPLTYFDGPIRDAHDAAKPKRQSVEIVRGVGEPPEPSNGSAGPLYRDVKELVRQSKAKQQQPTTAPSPPRI